jgi:hypothetical protein
MSLVSDITEIFVRQKLSGPRCVVLLPDILNSMNIFFCAELPRALVCAAPCPQTSILHSDFPTGRFQFSGGTNVTLEGSTDPHWGWVDSHGQQVKSTMLIACKCVYSPESVSGGTLCKQNLHR